MVGRVKSHCFSAILSLSFFGTVLSAAIATELLSTNPPTAAPKSRVVAVQDAQATEAFAAKADVVRGMLNRAMMEYTRRPDVATAWGSLVKTQDVVGIKVYSAPGGIVGTRVAVVEAVVQGLLVAGLPAKQIVIWDRRKVDLQRAGYEVLTERYGVRLAGSLDAGYDDKVFYESPLLGRLLAGDLEFESPTEQLGRKSHVTKHLTGPLTKIINVSPLLNQYDAGVAGNLYSLALGSVDNTRRFEGSTDALARAVPEIYAMKEVGDKVVLNITDALLCQFEGGEFVRLHQASVLNELRVSRDPVALDVLATRDLAAAREKAGFPAVSTNWFDLYQNASLLELGISDVKKIQVDVVK